MERLAFPLALAALAAARPAPPAPPKPVSAPVAAPRAPLVSGSPHRYGRWDLDQPLAQLRAAPELKDCGPALAAPTGHADCALPPNPEHAARLQIAWEESGRGAPDAIALHIAFEPAVSAPLLDLEWTLTRAWGAPVLEQMRREREQKTFTLQWEDAEHRATLEGQGSLTQPARITGLTFERRAAQLPGELATLHPHPFAGFRLRGVRRLEGQAQSHALVWGTSLTPAQEAQGEAGEAWATQHSYVGIWKLEQQHGARRWHPLWERVLPSDDDEESDRVLLVDTRDLTNDGTPDIEVELSCGTCGGTATEVLVKTIRAGKLVDLLTKRDLYRAQVELSPGLVRIREPEGDDDETTSVATYSFDRGRGAFVLSREERVGR